MAASRLQGGGGHCDKVSDILWRNFLCTEQGWDRIVMAPESIVESEGEDDIIPLYDVIDKNMAFFLPAI